MKKQALVAAVLAATAMSSTAFAATNPFKDLPEGHWAYDAVNMLAEDGVIEGYGDGTFNGTKTMNRYEMAEIVAKASEKYGTAALKDKGVLKKLEREFATELKDMDVRLTAVENDVKEMKKGISSFKWWGDARVRYFRNKKMTEVKNGYAVKPQNEFNKVNSNELRLRLGFYGEPADNLSVTGQLKFETDNVAKSSNNKDHGNNYNANGIGYEKVGVNRLQLDWRAKNDFTLSIGRNELSLGQGIIYWENPIDAVMVRKNFGDKASLLVGYGDATPGTWADNSDYAFFADLKYKASPALTLTAAYYNSHSDTQVKSDAYATWDGGATWTWKQKDTVSRNFKQFAYGLNAQLAPKWNLIAEGVHNGADVTVNAYDGAADWGAKSSAVHDKGRNGWWTRLTYGKMDWNKGGTWKVYGEYLALGGLAVDSTGWAHRLNVAGGNGYGGAGMRGWGLAFDYMLAPNMNLELAWYKVKPYTSTDAFDGYKDTGFASLTYSF